MQKSWIAALNGGRGSCESGANPPSSDYGGTEECARSTRWRDCGRRMVICRLVGKGASQVCESGIAAAALLPHSKALSRKREWAGRGGRPRKATELVGFVGLEGNVAFRTQRFEREGGGDEGGQKWVACVRLGSHKFRKMKNLVWPIWVMEKRQRFGALSGKLPRRNRWLVVRRLSQWCESGAEAHALQTLARGTDLPRFGRAARVPFAFYRLLPPFTAFYRLSMWARANGIRETNQTPNRIRGFQSPLFGIIRLFVGGIFRIVGAYPTPESVPSRRRLRGQSRA